MTWWRRAAVRPALGLVFSLLFLGRLASAPWVHECPLSQASRTTAPAEAGDHSHHQGPDDQAPDPQSCKCSPTRCCPVVMVAAPQPGVPESIRLTHPPQSLGTQPLVCLGSAHLLPFATAPPL